MRRRNRETTFTGKGLKHYVINTYKLKIDIDFAHVYECACVLRPC